MGGIALAGGILVVDDEPDIVASIQSVLQGEFPRATVYGATSAEGALAILREQEIQLLLTDYKMPGMNGMDLMHEAHHIRPDLAAIMFTGFPDVHVAQAAINEENVMRFWVKPVEPDNLVEATAEALLMASA